MWVAPERSWLGSVFIKAIGRKIKLGMVVPYLICRSWWLIGISSSKRWKLCTPFRVVGVMNRRPSSWIDVVDMRAQSPFKVSGVLHGSYGEKAEASSTPLIILVVGSEMPLRFSSIVQLVGAEPSTLPFRSLLSWDKNCLPLPLILNTHRPLPPPSVARDG
jgi:hypothetical protein